MSEQTPHPFHHPGGGRRTSIQAPKGRQLDPDAVTEIRALLGDASLDRDLLIEHLHRIQDAYHGLSPRHLAALANLMKLSLVEVYEVATFYAHFNVATDDDTRMPTLTVRVCDSLPCIQAGGERLRAAIEDATSKTTRVVRAPCMGRCDRAPIAEVGHKHVDWATVKEITETIAASNTTPDVQPYETLDVAQKRGAYKILQSCISDQRTYEMVHEGIKNSDLRGMGGAGFPVAQKWEHVRAADGTRSVVINADEGEPGTFKDRYFLEREPHVFLEGALVSAWAVEAQALYIYLRDEYPGLHGVLKDAVAELEAAGIVEPGFVILRRGAGAYICG
ncbi:MAG TPA: NADH-quinone oxidoreductase subunit F, partial [Rhodospirillaceae bacterium]|nr:NADH-quinone oxidoreductase subunit F [Rhodospirillaceae bacterium]